MTLPHDRTDPAGTPREGDEAAFTSAVERHRRELQVHCYRMLGSFDDAEDLVQETFLRAWRYRASLQDGAPMRPWLYRIATNACLDALARDRRAAPAPDDEGTDARSRAGSLSDPGEVTWLQPFPDAKLETPGPREQEPDAVVVTKENIELAFLTVIQLLTPQQRAVLLLRELLGWSAKETAELLDVSVASVNSAMQRARATLREHLPSRRPEWPAHVDASEAERELLRRYVEASEKADVAGLAALIREDAIFRMPPFPETYAGRDVMVQSWIDGGFGSPAFGRLRCVVTRANLQPAVACYVVEEGDPVPRAMAIDVLRIEDGMISEIITFGAEVFEAFGLPETLPT